MAMLMARAAVLLGLCAARYDRVRQLPGAPLGLLEADGGGGAAAATYSGHLEVDGPSGGRLAIFFVYVRHGDSERPLLAWMNGGPGASSLTGLFTELGPLLLNGRSRPNPPWPSNWTLWANPHGWHQDASLLVWEQPAGVGFSRCASRGAGGGSGTDCGMWDDDTSAEANLRFLRAFFEAFPSERGRGLFVAGESYAGVYVPILAAKLLEQQQQQSPADRRLWPLRGVAVGNGCIGYGVPGGGGSDTLALLLGYLARAAPDVDPSAALRICGEDQLSRSAAGATDLTPPCRAALGALLEDIGDFNVYHKDGPCDPDDNGNWGEGDAFACGASGALQAYLGTLEAQRAMHAIPENATQPLRWEEWDGDGSHYNITRADVRPQYRELLAAGVPVLIYNGLRDTALPFQGAERWTRDIGGEVSEPRRLWSVTSGGKAAGHVVRYASGLTFVTVQGAGHLVPSERPQAARAMMSAFLQGEAPPRQGGDRCARIWLGRSWGDFCGGASGSGSSGGGAELLPPDSGASAGPSTDAAAQHEQAMEDDWLV